ncbi:MAG: lamin tail domain-containing protein [archaeon]
MILCLVLVPCAQGLNINEVMYNPIGDDNNKEFIEIFGIDNLSGYTIGDSSSNDSLVLLKYIPGSYSLIVEEGFNHSGLNCSIYSAGSTIGNNLNNDIDSIYLYSNGTVVDSMSYDGSLANNNNRSMELIIGLTNNSWQESCAIGGSPCLPNCVPAINETVNETINISINETTNTSINITVNVTMNETINQTINVTINETMNISINETMNQTINVSINETVPVINETTNATANETINVTINNTINITANVTNATINVTTNATNNTGNNSNITNATNPVPNLCSISINITTDKMIYENGEAMDITIMLTNKSHEFIIEYWVEDMFGSETKAKRSTSLLTKKSFTPKIADKDQVMIAKARLVFVDCNNSGAVEESGSLFIVKYSEWQPAEKEKCSCPSASSSSKTTTSSTGTTSSASKTSSIELVKIPESKKETAKIASFYTRTKKWRNNVTLYANINLGKDVKAEELELLLGSSLEEQKLEINSSGTISIYAKAEPGSNTFTLELLDEGIVIDTKILEANFSIEEKEVGAEKSSFVEPGMVDEQPVQNSTKTADPLTGKVVYESSNKRLTSYAPYILVFVMLIAIIALSLLKRK